MLLALLFAAAALPDWNAVQQETLKHYQALVRLDTTNPPGNEVRAVEYLRRVLDAEGIAYKIFAKDAARPNLVARLRGSGSGRPLLIMAHTDTVTVDLAKWKEHGPFSADRAGGYIYGRGTVDDKDNLVSALMTMLLLKRSGLKLERDVIFLAESAEEAGALQWGIGFMAEEHFEEVNAEFCLAEGGTLRRVAGKPFANLVGTAEKLPLQIRLIARGPSGHGSRPTPGNAVVALVGAVGAAAAWTPSMRLNDTTREYFERLAAISRPEQAARYNGLFDPEKAPQVQAWFKQHDPGHYSMITTSITPTILRAGRQVNVIPSEAEAVLDVRMLPGEDPEAFQSALSKVINNPNVQLVAGSEHRRPAAPPSRLNTALFRALETVQKRMYPEIRTLPSMSTGASDMAVLRAKGIDCYGIGPAIDAEDAEAGFGAHSDQERILESSLYDFVRYTYEVAVEVATRH